MTQGPIVLIMNQYAYYGKRMSTVHSVGQLSHFGLDINDQSTVIPGHKQQMVTPNWWIIPFNIINGLTWMPMQPSMDKDLAKLPHVIITSDDIYHPTMDSNIDEEDFTSFDECTSTTGSYLHHNSYGPDYV